MASSRPIRILVAPDSFKECLDAPEVSDAIASGLRRGSPEAEIVTLPMADGGEGTAAALATATDGRDVFCDVKDPLGRDITRSYGLSKRGDTAFVEMATASGLALVAPGERDPGIASTYGTGQMIRHALRGGATQIIVGLGGSATNDGGAGMAQALGYRLLDDEGNEIGPGGLALTGLDRIDVTNREALLDGAEIVAACDVVTPLCGPSGASYVFGPQKGADGAMVAALDAALCRFAEVILRDLDVDVMRLAGGGAAGGLGAGLVAFADALLRNGFTLVSEACGLEAQIAWADLVITGEGRFDAQSLQGKAPMGVARACKKHGKPVIVLAGSVGEDIGAAYEQGLSAAYSICSGPMDLEYAREHAERLLAQAAENVVRLFLASGRP